MPAEGTVDSSANVSQLQLRVEELAAELRSKSQEYQEALQREAAIAEILRVINDPQVDLASVFAVMLEKATRLCQAAYGHIWLCDGDGVRPVAVHGEASFADWMRQLPRIVDPGPTPLGRALASKRFVHVIDATEDEAYGTDHPVFRELVDRAGVRSLLLVPLIKADRVLGVLSTYRLERRPYSDRQIALLQSFAAQAVVAMENARLLSDLRERTGDLEEALEQQTATSDVLQVISRSTFDLQPVLQTLAETAVRLCRSDMCYVLRREGEVYRAVTVAASSGEALAGALAHQRHLETHPLAPGRGSVTGRVALSQQAVHIADTTTDPEYTLSEAVTLGRIRTQLGVPLMREGTMVGVIILTRQRVEPFSERHMALARSFADQAVIAIENTRLLSEQREALEQQTATANVLKVISRSTFNLQVVLDTLTESAARLCETEMAAIVRPKGEAYYWATSYGFSPEFTKYIKSYPISPGRDTVVGRVLLDGAIAHVPDVLADPEFGFREGRQLGDYRSVLAVPLLREGTLVGVLLLIRRRAQPFTDKQIELATTFADQAVIAIENSRLLGELRESEARHALVSDAVAEGIYEWNIETNALWVSQRLIDIFGFEGRELKAADWNELVHPEDFPGYRLALEDCFKGITRRFDCEYRFRHADGAYRWIEDRGVAVRNAAGRAVRVVGAVTDVTVRKESERELSEALAQQTATAEVLQVINSSPGNLAPVFDTVLMKAHALCAVAYGSLQLYDGEKFRAVAVHGLPEPLARRLREGVAPGPKHPTGRMLAGEDYFHIRDLAEIDDPLARATVEEGGIRTLLGVALRKDGKLLGRIIAGRKEVRPFSDREISLLQSFAAQAVIAIENARLLTEQREALERQTATAEVLQVINTSPGNLAPVFDAMLDKALNLCSAAFGVLWTYDGEHLHATAVRGATPAYREFLARGPHRPSHPSAHARLLRGSDIEHIADVADHDDYRSGGVTPRALVDLGGGRSVLAVALRKDGGFLGDIVIYRREVRPFADKEIELLKNFAAQAVIAIENARLINETREALEQQTATSEVLQVINASPGDLVPVFDTVLEKAMQLCGAAFGHLDTYDERGFQTAATRGVPARFAEYRSRNPSRYGPGTGPARMLAGEPIIYNLDLKDEDIYRDGEPNRRALVDLGGARSALQVALRKDETFLGFITLFRQEVCPFTQKQGVLLQNFAAQAVIAMENARLINETREALEQQTATSEVLEVINASPGNLAPVFDAMLDKALSLCGAAFGILWTFDGDFVHAAAIRGATPAYAEFLTSTPHRPGVDNAHGRLLGGEEFIHIADVAADAAYHSEDPVRRATIELGGARTLLAVALRKESVVLGFFVIYRREVRLFAEQQISLLQNFAAQAVIAIENARLINETREALEQQTATAEVLRVINSSPGNLAPVFETILEKARALCAVAYGSLQLYDGETFRAVAVHGLPEPLASRLREGVVPGPNHPGRQLLAGEDYVHLRDMAEIDDPVVRATVELGGLRTHLSVALRKDGRLLGRIVAMRNEVRPFSDNEIALLQSFAAQAVMAIENARLLTEQREALEQQTATADVLGVINSSPGDLAPVFEAMLEKATRLCEAAYGVLWTYDGNSFLGAASRGVPPELMTFLREPQAPAPGTGIGRLLAGEPYVHWEDLKESAAYRSVSPIARAFADLGGARTNVLVPLRSETALLGAISIYRQEVRPFSDKQIALLQNFAAQAVIAMENARLLGELRQRTDDLQESLEYQTATAEVLRIISSSPSSLEPVFEAVLTNAIRMSGGTFGMLALVDGDGFQGVATYAVGAEYSTTLSRIHDPPPGTGLDRLRTTHRTIEIADCAAERAYDRVRALNPAFASVRTALHIPMLRDTELVGAILVYRDKVAPFQASEIELVENFAKQAVIAMENARLLDELRQRQAELARSVDELTATSDVLKTISRSSTDLTSVLDTLLETVARLCRADQTYMFRRHDDDLYHLVASYGVPPEGEEYVRCHPFGRDRGTATRRAVFERRVVHIEDVLSDPEYTYREGQSRAGYRTLLGIPLLREETLIGVFSLGRTRVEPFEQKEIELANSFADQAVIAIENARLFEELRDRQAELRVTFDNMGDGVAMFDDGHRLAAWNRNFQEIIGLSDEWLARRPTYADYLGLLAERGEFGTDDVEALLQNADKELRRERTRPDGTVLEVRRNGVPGGGFVVIYSDVTERKRAEEKIRAARDVAETALRELKTAQASLIHAEKMASLGQLTAGIAHEIKNPLNFVNNFAGLSIELLDELKETVVQMREALDATSRAELDETIELLNTNLDKIRNHGRRADGIVKSMLLHSRGGSSDRQTVDINGVLEEALNLAYHGARAQDQSFNVTLERDLQAGLAPIEIVPQDVTRVFLNLIGNGFYAVAKRHRQEGEAFRPTLKVTSREVPGAIEITIRDNGVGIAAEHRARLFQPFFTTKPTGEGTGLGLSISYDIVTQQHGGTIIVDSEPGQFTEFTIRLPRGRQAALAAEGSA